MLASLALWILLVLGYVRHSACVPVSFLTLYARVDASVVKAIRRCPQLETYALFVHIVSILSCFYCLHRLVFVACNFKASSTNIVE
jgi:hypothetical protein